MALREVILSLPGHPKLVEGMLALLLVEHLTNRDAQVDPVDHLCQ